MLKDNTWTLIVFTLCHVQQSVQRCFSDPCSGPVGSLDECSRGEWLCHANEFCDIGVRQEVRQAFSMYYHDIVIQETCRPDAMLADCLAAHVSNDPRCDPAVRVSGTLEFPRPTGLPSSVCHWCCQDAACVRHLATSTTTSTFLSTQTTTVTTTTQH